LKCPPHFYSPGAIPGNNTNLLRLPLKECLTFPEAPGRSFADSPLTSDLKFLMKLLQSYLDHKYTDWPNSLDCTDLKISVEPAVTQNYVASVTYKHKYTVLENSVITS
jgi:hypothetical protein